MKKTLLVFLAIIVVCIVIFFTNTFLYQQLINQGSTIADEECLNVNPLLIARKNSFIIYIQDIKSSRGSKVVLDKMNTYMAASYKFDIAQEKWLKIENNYMHTWDYKIIVPTYFQKAALDQYTSRLADVNSSKDISTLLSETDSRKQKKLEQDVFAQVTKGNKADADYTEINKAGRRFDLRDYFVRVPPTKCPNANFDIPDTSNLFANPTPTPIFAPDIPGGV